MTCRPRPSPVERTKPGVTGNPKSPVTEGEERDYKICHASLASQRSSIQGCRRDAPFPDWLPPAAWRTLRPPGDVGDRSHPRNALSSFRGSLEYGVKALSPGVETPCRQVKRPHCTINKATASTGLLPSQAPGQGRSPILRRIPGSIWWLRRRERISRSMGMATCPSSWRRRRSLACPRTWR
jgi:hypothetical protein